MKSTCTWLLTKHLASPLKCLYIHLVPTSQFVSQIFSTNIQSPNKSRSSPSTDYRRIVLYLNTILSSRQLPGLNSCQDVRLWRLPA